MVIICSGLRPQGPTRCHAGPNAAGGLSSDIVIPDRRIALDVDVDYWHGDSLTCCGSTLTLPGLRE